MRLRTILVFGLGYVLGARAGRERYLELREVAERVADTPGAKRARGVVELAFERIRDVFE